MKDDAEGLGGFDPLGCLGWHRDPLVSDQRLPLCYRAACSMSLQKAARRELLCIQECVLVCCTTLLSLCLYCYGSGTSSRGTRDLILYDLI
jgi:hypothetical protein